MTELELWRQLRGHKHFYMEALDFKDRNAAWDLVQRLYKEGLLSCRTTVVDETDRPIFQVGKYLSRERAELIALAEWEDRTAEHLSADQVDVRHLWVIEVQR